LVSWIVTRRCGTDCPRRGVVAWTPRPLLDHNLSKDDNDEPGDYCVDCTSGKAHFRDRVMVGGSHARKTSDGAIRYTVERCRVEDLSRSPHRSTDGNERTVVGFGDVLATRCDDSFTLDNPEMYAMFDGANLVDTECGGSRESQLYLTDAATLDAPKTAVYSIRAKSAVGSESDTSTSGATLGSYFFCDNDDPAADFDNVTIDMMAERDKMDIEGVPGEGDVGAWRLLENPLDSPW
jgi:hypothetical protein